MQRLDCNQQQEVIGQNMAKQSVRSLLGNVCEFPN